MFGDRQARLTQRLLATRPVYRSVGVDGWIGAVQESLGAPVVLASYGPTAEDKVDRQRLTESPTWSERYPPSTGSGNTVPVSRTVVPSDTRM